MDKQLSITESLSQSGLEAIDYLILLIYIAMLISLGFFLNYSRENKSKDKTAANYFLAGNTLTWWAVGATIFTMDIYRKNINSKASGEKLVSIGRTFSIFALLVAAIAVNPMLSGRDQAFLYIQEYSGLIFPGIVIVCGFGLLWKRASTLAAIWSAILTVPLGLLLKLGFPDTPLILRTGYVFIILSAIFIMLSFTNEHVEPSQKIPDMVLNSMKKWSYILGGIAAFLIGIATFVSIGSLLLPPDATPCNNAIAYLDDIGFQAFYFFGAFIGSCAMLLYSNVFSKMQDHKALTIKLSIFKTTRGYTIGTIGICLITLILYIIFW